jgi:uncharacterized protein (TIGR03435 family)
MAIWCNRKNMRRAARTLALGALLVSALVVLLQSQESASVPSFEVASVKPSPAGDNAPSVGLKPGGHYTVANASLKMLLVAAYGIRDYQIAGGPGWTGSDRRTVDAKAPEGSLPPTLGPPDSEHPDPLMRMIQSLLKERFQLKAHLETREAPVYELVVAKAGSKMKLSENQEPVEFPKAPAGSVPPRGLMRLNPVRGSLVGSSVPISTLAGALSEAGFLSRRVIDKTGLKGLYDFDLEWKPDPGLGPTFPAAAAPPPEDDSSRPSLVTALQEQLGLRAEPAKGPVEFVVIDSVAKPEAD